MSILETQRLPGRPRRSSGKGRRPSSRRAASPGIESLEGRIVLDSKTFGGLEFLTSSNNSWTTNSSGVTSTTVPVQIGIAPASSEGTFTAVLKVDGGVSYKASVSTYHFNTTGNIEAISSPSNLILPLDQSSFTTTSLINGFAPMGSVSAPFGGVSLSMANIQVASGGLDLQGSIALSQLGGIKFDVLKSNDLILSSSGPKLTGATVESSQSFGLGGAQFSVTSAGLDYNATSNQLGISGALSLGVLGKSVALTLGNSSGADGIVIKGGTLQSLQGIISGPEIDLGGSNGLAITDENLSVSYPVPNTTNEIGITGSANVKLPDVNAPISVSLGNATTPGILYQQGHGLVAFNLAIDTTTTGSDGKQEAVEFTTHGLTIKPSSTTISYQQTTANDATHEDFQFTGGDSFSFDVGKQAQEISVNLGDASKGVVGLDIYDGALKSLDATVSADFSVDGLEVTAKDVTVAYDGTAKTFDLDGSVGVKLGDSLDVTATFGDGGQNHGIVIDNGTLEGAYSVVDGGFSLFGVSVAAKGLTIDYESSKNSLELSGGVRVDLTSSIGGDAELTQGGLLIDTQTGGFSIDSTNGFGITMDVQVGPFAVKNLDVVISEGTNNAVNIKASGGIDVTGSFQIVNGQLNEIGLSLQSAEGVPLGDTGVFITGLSGEIDNLADPSTIEIVNTSVSLIYGETVSIGTNNYNLITATVGITKLDKDELILTGSVQPVDGILGSGTATVDLNWSTGQYSAALEVSLLDGAITVDASANLDSEGDLTVQGMASAQVPSGSRSSAGPKSLR